LKNTFPKTLKSVFIFAIIVVAIAISTYYEYSLILKTPKDALDTEKISFLIKKNQSVREIGKSLEESEIIDSSQVFYAYVKLNDFDKKIISGRFYLQKSMNIIDIVNTITEPKNAEILFTIQEGLLLRDIDKKLVELDMIAPGEFLQAAKNFEGWNYYEFLNKEELSQLEYPIEGYIYPDTYFLNSADFKPNRLIYTAMDNFENKFKDLYPLIKKHSVNEIITMASIIENEVYGEEDRKIVSGILWKRLENNWFLGADATLLYIKDDRQISGKDLKIDSKYNTRSSKGLPPGPICNPSIESIKAAMYPKESEYWYYLTDKKGKVIYSKTNEEHNINRAKYL